LDADSKGTNSCGGVDECVAKNTVGDEDPLAVVVFGRGNNRPGDG